MNSEAVPGSEIYSTSCDQTLAVILEFVISETVLGSESTVTTCEFQSSSGWGCDVGGSALQGVWAGAHLPATCSKPFSEGAQTGGWGIMTIQIAPWILEFAPQILGSTRDDFSQMVLKFKAKCTGVNEWPKSQMVKYHEG